MYTLLTVLFTFGTLVYAFDGHIIIKEKYKRFRELNKLVQTRYKNIGMILWVSSCMVAKMYWMNFLHWANNTIEHIDPKTTIISYVLNGKLYRFVVRAKKGPVNVLLVTDEDFNDVSDKILPFMGPGQDWHGQEFTPAFWKKNTLTFEFANGEHKTFSENEPIKILT